MGLPPANEGLTSKGHRMRTILLTLVFLVAIIPPASAQLLAAAGKVDITPSRPVYIAAYGSNRLPGEALPNIGFYLKRQMTGEPKFLLGLTGDALGYILTAEDYGLKLYQYETSVSIGSMMGRLMEENLLALMKDGKKGRK